jgi:hypothetical protein
MMASAVVDEEDAMKRISVRGFRVGRVWVLVGLWEGGFWEIGDSGKGNRERDQRSTSWSWRVVKIVEKTTVREITGGGGG